MSLSSICAEQHEKEAAALKKFVAFSLVGSVGLHLAMLALSQLFPASAVKVDSAVIELVVTAPPPEPEVIEETPELSPEFPTPVTTETTTTTAVATEVEEPTRVESQFQVEGDSENSEEVDWSDALARVAQPQPGSQGVGAAASPGRGGSGRRQAANPGRRRPRTVRCAYCPKPNYPESALADGVEGSPVVLIDTDANGNVVGVRLTQSSGNAALDQAAIGATRGWRLETGGYAVSNIPIEIEMNIRGSRRHRESQRRGERREMQLPGSETAASEPAEATSPAAIETRQSPAPASNETDASNAQPVETGGDPASVDANAPEPTDAPPLPPTETHQPSAPASGEADASNAQPVETGGDPVLVDRQETVPAAENAAPNPAAASESAPESGATVPAETPSTLETVPTEPHLAPEPALTTPAAPSSRP